MTIIKEHQGRFDREARLWYAPYKNYIQIFQKLKECQALGETNLFPITNLPVEVLTKINYNKLKFLIEKSPYEIDYSKDRVHTIFELPSNMLTSLYNFQKIGIEFGINKKGRMLLADEMGVGKTIQAIGISAIYREDWPVLILCPSSLKYNWRDEILNWLGEIVDKKEVQIIKKSKDEFDKEMKFCICSYDLSIRKADSIQEKNFKFAIADEAHYLKSKESKRSKLMIPILQRCKRLLLLSGTPILAKPVEIYPLLKALRPDIFSSFKAFGTRYCDPKNTAFGVDWSGASNSKELHFIISNFMIRRLKKDVLAELPPKKRQKVEIQTDKKVINQIRVLLNKVNKKELENDEVVLKLIDEQNNSNEDKPEDSLNCFTKAYSLTGKAKITGIVDYVNYLLVNKCKFLIFAHHLEVLDSIEEEVKKQEVKYIRIDGSLNQEKRHICVNIFQNDETCLVAILAITACATGLTLTKASTVVFTEMHFTPAIMIQAEDRAHRIGQEHTCVNVHYLYGADTVDEILFPKLREKFFVVSTTLDDKRMDMDVQKIKSGCIGDFETKNKKENESKSGHFNQNEKVLKLNNDNKNHSGRKTLTDYFHVINKKKKDEAQDENKETSISNTENVNDINLHEGEKKRNRNMLDDCCTDSSILENSFEWIEERGDVFNKNSKFDEEGI